MDDRIKLSVTPSESSLKPSFQEVLLRAFPPQYCQSSQDDNVKNQNISVRHLKAESPRTLISFLLRRHFIPASAFIDAFTSCSNKTII
jgi:hypothetical protein